MYPCLVPACMAALLSSVIPGPSRQGPTLERAATTYGGLARRADWGASLVFDGGRTRVATVRSGGAYTIPAMRVGGPYEVTVSMIGFQPGTEHNLFLNLGQALQQDFHLAPIAGEVDVELAEDLTTENVVATPQGWLRRVDAQGAVHADHSALQRLPAQTVGQRQSPNHNLAQVGDRHGLRQVP